jgi:hypothetical protein
MRLFEFATDPLITKLVAVTDQLKNELDDGSIDPEMSLENFIQYLQEYGITLDTNDLYNMIKKPPLNDLISNIQADQVIFKGYGTVEQPEDEKKKVVKQMAKSAQEL